MFKEYARYYDLANSDKPYEKECGFVYNWAEQPTLMLDVGCGTANYWKYFPNRFFGQNITGIEKSEHMIRQASPFLRKFIYCADVSKTRFWWHKKVDCVTALFNVINYLPTQRWWHRLPLKPGGFFIFDIWDMKKVKRDGFKHTEKNGRTIAPEFGNAFVKDDIIRLHIRMNDIDETHTIYLYSEEDLKQFCGKRFEVADKKETQRWQTWYKLRRL